MKATSATGAASAPERRVPSQWISCNDREQLLRDLLYESKVEVVGLLMGGDVYSPLARTLPSGVEEAVSAASVCVMGLARFLGFVPNFKARIVFALSTAVQACVQISI